MTKSIAVLGLGKYGTSLVRALNEMGADVLAVDRREANVKEIADVCSAAICADLSHEENIMSLGLKDMDIVVVAMGQSLEASILSVAVAKEQGVPLIVAKSNSGRMSSILRKVGANKVIMPEEYAGLRSATILVSETILDFFQVGNGLCMVEMLPLKGWVGKSLIELGLRTKMDINVVARKDEEGKWLLADPTKPLQETSKLLVVLERKTLNRLKH